MVKDQISYIRLQIPKQGKNIDQTKVLLENEYGVFQKLLKDNALFLEYGEADRKENVWSAEERGCVSKHGDDVETTTNGTQLLKIF